MTISCESLEAFLTLHFSHLEQFIDTQSSLSEISREVNSLTVGYSQCKSLGSSLVDALVYSDSCHARQCQTHGDHQSFLNNQQKQIAF